MLDFIIDEKLCTRCGQCEMDCPMRIIKMHNGGPLISTEDEPKCIRCQHCLSVCPVGAVAIGGYKPENSEPVGQFPSAVQMEALIKGRRSIRRFKAENIDPQLTRKLIEVTSYAPTGRNSRQVRFTVIDEREKLVRFRDELMNGLGQLVRDRQLPQGMEYMAAIVRTWEEKRVDIVFRNAPHLVIASAPKTVVSPIPDCIIALTTFELYAQAAGLGTLWCGLVKFALSDLLPSLRKRLGIPEEHVFGYAMAFGYPAVHYARLVQRKPMDIVWSDL